MNKTLQADRRHGLERLAAFVPRAGADYAANHDYDLGPDSRDNVSGLSPFLSHRLITDGEVLASVLESHTPAKAESFVSELLWKTYWKGWLEGRPQVYSHWLRLVAEDSRHWPEREDFQRAVTGRTGIEPFDFWVSELKSTGYLHHHARMWFASIWIFTLKLPWSLGARFFLEHLLDGDVASNTLSWRWVAGLHTKGKHYVAKAENIKKYTKGRFNPQGQLNETPSPLSGPAEPPYVSPVNFPFSASEALGEKYAVLLTGDDLHPESDALGLMKPSLVVTLCPKEAHRALHVSEKVLDFKTEAMRDAADRAGNHFSCPVLELLLEEDPPAALDRLMKSHGLKSLVYYEPFVGPWKDHISTLSSRDVGVTFFPLRRPWDGLLHPHAVKGYFHFKKYALPQVLRTKGNFQSKR